MTKLERKTICISLNERWIMTLDGKVHRVEKYGSEYFGWGDEVFHCYDGKYKTNQVYAVSYENEPSNWVVWWEPKEQDELDAVFALIKRKQVNVERLISSTDCMEYNKAYQIDDVFHKLQDEEYDLLKRMLM